MAASNTTIMASMATINRERTDQNQSRNSDRMMDISRENSPMLNRRGHVTSPREPNSVASNMKICVSGRVFELTAAQIRRYPDSLLADPNRMANFYQPEIGMFFFDRNRFVFEYIMQFYQSDGYMEFPEDVPSQLLEIELNFYRIGHRIAKEAEEEPVNVDPTIWAKGRDFFGEPSSSIFAKIWMGLDIFFIVISVVIFMVRTEQSMIQMERTMPELKLFFWVITILCAVFFTVDLVGRFIFSVDKVRFFFDVMPWLDIVAIIPIYFEIFEDYIKVQGDMLNILKLFRMARVARCLKLIRRSKRLVLIFQILVQCKEELSILLLVWTTGTVISGSIMYYVETNLINKIKFYSIMESCWWAITTIGTIGYGNIVPDSAVGQIITTVIIFCSMIFMTVPMTIIIRRFSDSYEQFERKKMEIKLFGHCNFRTVSPAPSIRKHSNNTGAWNQKSSPTAMGNNSNSNRSSESPVPPLVPTSSGCCPLVVGNNQLAVHVPTQRSRSRSECLPSKTRIAE